MIVFSCRHWLTGQTKGAYAPRPLLLFRERWDWCFGMQCSKQPSPGFQVIMETCRAFLLLWMDPWIQQTYLSTHPLLYTYTLTVPMPSNLKITPKYLFWIFSILAFSANFCPIKIDLSGYTFTPKILHFRAKNGLEIWYCSFFVYTILNFPRFFYWTGLSKVREIQNSENKKCTISAISEF